MTWNLKKKLPVLTRRQMLLMTNPAKNLLKLQLMREFESCREMKMRFDPTEVDLFRRWGWERGRSHQIRRTLSLLETFLILQRCLQSPTDPVRPPETIHWDTHPEHFMALTNQHPSTTTLTVYQSRSTPPRPSHPRHQDDLSGDVAMTHRVTWLRLRRWQWRISPDSCLRWSGSRQTSQQRMDPGRYQIHLSSYLLLCLCPTSQFIVSDIPTSNLFYKHIWGNISFLLWHSTLMQIQIK